MGCVRTAWQSSSVLASDTEADWRLVLQLANQALENGHREWAEDLLTIVYNILDRYATENES